MDFFQSKQHKQTATALSVIKGDFQIDQKWLLETQKGYHYDDPSFQ